jgi:amino acid adenylation domain-containing protein
MQDSTSLHQYLEQSASRRSEQTAVEEPEGATITYRELDALSDRLRDRLRHMGVGSGDRVGIYLRKSIDAVAAIFGILKAGAAYVPVDPGAPAARNAYIHNDCSVKAVVIEARYAEDYATEIRQIGQVPPMLIVDEAGGGEPLRTLLEREAERDPASVSQTAHTALDDLAYILYTSGSTGKPKGVMLSHRNAVTFVDWCSEVFEPQAEDRFSSHAPFHFDLSILDLYVSIKHAATLNLIGEEIGKDPARLAQLIAEKRISIWYSAPSILGLLVQFGKLERYDYSALRIVLFAGEVFPIKHLRALKSLWPHPRYFNLYGPTETNVCTYYEIPATIPEERTQPYPIGKVCSHLRGRVVDEAGRDVALGQEGELCISGAGVMQGYWNLPDRTANAFLADQAGGERWYKTGDIVIEDGEEGAGDYLFLGRRDRMVKKRGYRVELGEIEACLYRHPAVRDAAVIALQDEEAGVRIKAFLGCGEGTSPSIIELKRFCAENLPLYMVPDLFSIRQQLPKTSTAKVDYQSLQAEEP